METSVTISSISKSDIYKEIIPQIKSLVEGESNLVANLANTASALKLAITSASWVGFYLVEGNELVLGPFQGTPACVRIELGRGVCGTTAQKNETIVVPNVHEFPGHIACDPDSKSEIVVPINHQGKVVGVLDVDSAEFNSFDIIDKQYLEELCDWLGGNVFR